MFRISAHSSRGNATSSKQNIATDQQNSQVYTWILKYLVFKLIPVCSKLKFKFVTSIQLLGLKTTSHGKPDLKNWFLRSDLPYEVVFWPKKWILVANLNFNLLQTAISLKTKYFKILCMGVPRPATNEYYTPKKTSWYRDYMIRRILWYIEQYKSYGGSKL